MKPSQKPTEPSKQTKLPFAQPQTSTAALSSRSIVGATGRTPGFYFDGNDFQDVHDYGDIGHDAQCKEARSHGELTNDPTILESQVSNKNKHKHTTAISMSNEQIWKRFQNELAGYNLKFDEMHPTNGGNQFIKNLIDDSPNEMIRDHHKIINKFSETYGVPLLQTGATAFADIDYEKPMIHVHGNFPPDTVLAHSGCSSFDFCINKKGRCMVKNTSMDILLRLLPAICKAMGWMRGEADVDLMRRQTMITNWQPVPAEASSSPPYKESDTTHLVDRAHFPEKIQFPDGTITSIPVEIMKDIVKNHWMPLLELIKVELGNKFPEVKQLTIGKYALESLRIMGHSEEEGQIYSICHPHRMLKGVTTEELVNTFQVYLKLAKEIGCDVRDVNESEINLMLQGKIFSFIRRASVETMPQCQPDGTLPKETWREKNPQCQPDGTLPKETWREKNPSCQPDGTLPKETWKKKKNEKSPQCQPDGTLPKETWREKNPSCQPDGTLPKETWREKKNEKSPQCQPDGTLPKETWKKKLRESVQRYHLQKTEISSLAKGVASSLKAGSNPQSLPDSFVIGNRNVVIVGNIGKQVIWGNEVLKSLIDLFMEDFFRDAEANKLLKRREIVQKKKKICEEVLKCLKRMDPCLQFLNKQTVIVDDDDIIIKFIYDKVRRIKKKPYTS